MFIDYAPNPFASASVLQGTSIAQSSGKKYARPDTTVCYHLLLYRDLVKNPCGAGTTFRPEREPPSGEEVCSDAVSKLSWWQKVEDGVPILAFDDLLNRLWKNGVLSPFRDASGEGSESASPNFGGVDVHYVGTPAAPRKPATSIPHELWMTRLGFQEPDPRADFRSGGLFSLACLVYVVESRPDVCRRFDAQTGDLAGILPLAGTSINVTDMIADLLMLKPSDESVAALLRPQPFWGAFRDPSAILVLQGLCLDVLADIVIELQAERVAEMANMGAQVEETFEDEEDEFPSHGGKVTAFDFPLIMERTKARVVKDLLGVGPRSINELKIAAKNLKKRFSDTH